MRFIAKESSAAETIGKQWMADKCGYRDGVRNMNTDVGAELRSRLRARSGSATGCHRQVIHYRPPCGARNFLLAAASRNFDRCTFRAQPSSAAGGGRLSERYLHQFRLAASDVSARCRLAVPEISCSLPLAKFRPLHVSHPAFFRRRRRQGVKPLSNQNKKALRRSAFLFWQPNRDSNPNIQSQSLLCYRYTIRLYLLLAENSISVCSPVVNSFLQFSKNYA